VPADLTVLSKNSGNKFPTVKVSRIIEGEDVRASHGTRDMPMWGPVFRGLGAPGDQQEVQIRLNSLTDYLASIQQK
jgi:hypothetical protein